MAEERKKSAVINHINKFGTSQKMVNIIFLFAPAKTAFN
jgi:hypothetical protein